MLYQLGALDAFAQVAGTGVAYVKPHGALYHACIDAPRTGRSGRGRGARVRPVARRARCAGLAVAGGRRRAGHGAGGRGVRRPGLSRRRHAGAADRAGCGAHRSRPRSPPVPLPSPPSGKVTAVDGTRGRYRCPLDLHPRRHARRRGPGAGGAGGARAGVGRGPSPSPGERCGSCRWGTTPCWSSEIDASRRRGRQALRRSISLVSSTSCRPRSDGAGRLRRRAARWRTVRRRLREVRPAELDSGARSTIAVEIAVSVRRRRPRRRGGSDRARRSTKWSPLTRRRRTVVAFCGFSPGFAYLRGADSGCTSRGDRHRGHAVPAGSVAVAAGYTAVYPRTSPGGWHLLGAHRRGDVRSRPFAAGCCSSRDDGQVRGA